MVLHCVLLTPDRASTAKHDWEKRAPDSKTKVCQLEAMARKIGEDNISRLIQVALLEFIERHDGMDANDFAKLKQRLQTRKKQ